MSRLSGSEYLEVIKKTHLISVDVLVFCEGKVLVGERKNNPAKGYLFVPGCRMYKIETLEDCLYRCLKWEMNLAPRNATKNGCYIHTYNNNFMNDDVGTKYIVFPYRIEVLPDEKNEIERCMTEQHSRCLWLTPEELVEHPDVHLYTKYYFCRDSPPNKLL